MKKNLAYYLELEYSARLKRNQDGSYFAEIEELPGCFTEADSQEQALTQLEDAKKAWLTLAVERELPISEPAQDEFSGKLHLRLPKSLHRHLAYRAKQEGVSLNTLITTRLAAQSL